MGKHDVMYHIVMLTTKAFTNWVMGPREMRNRCRSCTGTHLQFEFESHSSRGNCLSAGHCSALWNKRAPVLSCPSDIPPFRA